ncbi:MAG: hypothetical protein A2017_06885 [Lentisphaerae bacterium GWF2_44_16]|nr:MAG: hypothetical protein A2017_06885 [Lentisphaerae bacterium GWF2_44_16]
MDIIQVFAVKEILSNLKIWIHKVDYTVCGKSWNFRNINSPFARFYYLEYGEGEVEHSGKVFKLRPGYAYFLPSREPLHLSCSSEHGQYYIHFNAEILNGIDIFQFLHPAHQVKVKDNEYIKKLLKNLLEKYYKTETSDILESQGIMRILVSLFFSEITETQSSQKIAAVVRFKKALHYIEEHFTEDITLTQLADLMHLQPTYFSNLFCSYFSIPPMQYITRKRIEKAQNLLISSEYSVNEIAARTGYEDVFYFSRLFRKYSGSSPKHYRKQKLYLVN